MKIWLALALWLPTAVLAAPLSLDDQIGQMLMVGFRGTTIGNSTEVVRDILQYHVGGILIFDTDVQLHAQRNVVNPTQLKELIAALQSLSPTPLLVSADQEGGAVTKLKEKYGFHPSQSAQSLGDRNDLSYTAQAASVLAGDLASVAINLNLAPVVDLNINPLNPILGKIGRCFSADPEIVTNQARAFIDSHHRLAILTTLKHFPGHGSATADSHL